MRFARKLCLEIGLLGAAHPAPGRIAALRHEAFDDAVERHAVIEALARQFLDPRHMIGREIGAQLYHHPALGKVHIDGVLGIAGHYFASFRIFTETILVGLGGGSPLAMRSTHSMPEATPPNTVYFPSR